MYSHRFTRIFPSGCFFPLYLILGVLTLGAGSIFLDSFIPLAALIPVWVLVLMMEEGIEIDWETKQYRDYRRFFVRTGKWKKLPPSITGVKLSSGNESQTMNSARTMGAQKTLTEKVYMVKLMFPTNKGEKGLLVFKSNDRSEAEHQLQYFKERLKEIYGI